MPAHLWVGREATLFSAFSSSMLPLGGVLHLIGQEVLEISSVVSLIQRLVLNPWVPVVAHSDVEKLARAIFPPSIYLLTPPVPSLRPDAYHPIKVACRTVPTDEEFFGYIDLRLKHERAELVRGLFTTFGGESTKRRKLARRQMPTPHLWMELWAMLPILSDASDVGVHSKKRTEVEVARRQGVSVKTLSQRCHRLFELSWRESVVLPWPARVERFFRVHGLSG